MSMVPEDDDIITEPTSDSDDLFGAEPETELPVSEEEPEPSMADWADIAEVAPRDVKEGEIRQGIVVAVDNEGVVVDIGAKVEGVISMAEFPSASDRPNVDDEIEVAVVKIDEENEIIRLSKRRADYERVWNELEELAKEGGIVQAMVTERVKGGLRVDVGVPGFVPASHVGTRNLQNLERFVGRSLRLKVLEADRKSKKAILSHRELVEAEREDRKKETMARLAEGIVCEGKVRSLTNYGAFVDLGGIDGLLHISEMAWTRIKHPSDVMKVGDTVSVVVLEISPEGERISLGMRQILPDPWKEAAAKLKVNTVVKARITRLVRTGAFAQLLEAGIEGFIPIREMSEKRIGDPSEVLQRDQDVDLKILDINRNARKMSLSLIAAAQEKERIELRSFMSQQEVARPTLGDQFADVLASLKAEHEEAEDETELELEVAEQIEEEIAAEALAEVVVEVAEGIAEEVAAQVAAEVAAEVRAELATEVPEEIAEEVAAEVAAAVAAEARAQVAAEVVEEVLEELAAEVLVETEPEPEPEPAVAAEPAPEMAAEPQPEPAAEPQPECAAKAPAEEG